MDVKKKKKEANNIHTNAHRHTRIFSTDRLNVALR